MAFETPYCPRCGSPLVGSETEASCSYCQMIDQSSVQYLWSPEKLEEQLAQDRARNAQSRAEVEADFAGKSAEQILAESEVEAQRTQRREEVAARVMPKPVVYGSGKSFQEMTEIEKLEVGQWIDEVNFALPPEIPRFNGPLIFRGLTSLNGDEDGPIPGAALAFDHRGFFFGADGNPEPTFFNCFPWSHLHSVEVSDHQQIQERITLPRAATFGLFSLGLKKRTISSYLSLTIGVEAPSRIDVYEVRGLSPMELTAQVSPVSLWLDTNYAAIQSFAY